MIISGIYVIENLQNGKKYYGGSVNIKKRWNEHRWALNKSVHPNPKLQRAWIKYGSDQFQFKILKRCRENLIESLEQSYLDKFVGSENCYNIAQNAGSMLGIPCSESRKLAISLANKGKAGNMYWKGKSFSKKHKMALSLAAKRRKATEKTRKNMSIAMQGKNSKLTKNEVRKIRFLWNSGKKQNLLSQIFEVSNTQIWDIVHNNSWSWVK